MVKEGPQLPVKMDTEGRDADDYGNGRKRKEVW